MLMLRRPTLPGTNRRGQGKNRSIPMRLPFVIIFLIVIWIFIWGLFWGRPATMAVKLAKRFYTASQIKDGDAASWQAAWIHTANRLFSRAETNLAAGHQISACRELQRASYYYRASTMSMMPDDARVKEMAHRSRSCLLRAGELMDVSLEYIEIPFEGTVLPGFFRKADHSGLPRPTLLMIGGGETFAEDLWFHIGSQAFERGYNFITVDLPGQGLLPWEGKYFRPAMNIPITAVIDYALERPEVDGSRLVAYGISSGGVFAPQAAMNDQRIKAVAVTSAVVDAERLVANMPTARTNAEMMATFSSFHRNVVKLIAYRWGVSMDDIPGLVAANKGFVFDPAQVFCPMLILVGAGEFSSKEVQNQQNLKSVSINCLIPLKKLVVTDFAEGASSHCIPENRSLMGEILFDWFAEVLQ